jgi:hypothetical protein
MHATAAGEKLKDGAASPANNKLNKDFRAVRRREASGINYPSQR